MATKARKHHRRRRSGRRTAASLLVAIIADALAKIVLAVLERLVQAPPRGLP